MFVIYILLTIALLIFCFTFFAHSTPAKQDRRLDKSRLRIVNFNPEWLFHFGGSGETQCPGLNCAWKTQEQSLDHLTKIASILLAIDADIIHLDEVENIEVLKVLVSIMTTMIEKMPFKLNCTSKDGHGYVPYMVRGSDYSTGQNVAVITRIDPTVALWRSNAKASFPIKDSNCCAQGDECPRGWTTLSKHYFAHIQPEGWPSLLLVGVHLIAHPEVPIRCAKREAQALLVNELIERSREKLKFDDIILLGDMNDHDRDCPGADGSLPLSQVHPNLLSYI